MIKSLKVMNFLDEYSRAMDPPAKAFSDFTASVKTNLGMDLSIYKNEYVMRFVTRILQKYTLKDLGELTALLCDNANTTAKCNTTAEEAELIKKETYEHFPCRVTKFFRDFDQAGFIIDYLKALPFNKLDILSAGCGSGQEPYSLAMLFERDGIVKEFEYEILAVDCLDELLSEAKVAIYPINMIDGIKSEYTEFIEANVNDKKISIRDNIRNRIKYENDNLISDEFGKKYENRFNLVLLRYVTVFLKTDIAYLVYSNIVKTLTAGGLLWLGTGEYIDNPRRYDLKPIKPGIYSHTD